MRLLTLGWLGWILLTFAAAGGLRALAAEDVVDRAEKKDRKEKTHDVTIKDVKYDPGTIKIHVGETVVWTNEDDRDHSVNAEDGSFKSGTIHRNRTYSHKFEKAGKFPYTCGLHRRMKGTVIVLSDKAAKATD